MLEPTFNPEHEQYSLVIRSLCLDPFFTAGEFAPAANAYIEGEQVTENPAGDRMVLLGHAAGTWLSARAVERQVAWMQGRYKMCASCGGVFSTEMGPIPADVKLPPGINCPSCGGKAEDDAS
jgi:hypothetical protein